MPSTRVLFVASDSKSRELVPRALQSERPDLEVETAEIVSKALALVSQSAYDAVVCCADSPDEIAWVIRIKKVHPQLPVVVLSRVREPGFGVLAESFGASAVVRKTAGLSETARALLNALETWALAGNRTFSPRRTSDLANDVRRLAKANRGLVELGLGVSAASEGRFMILLVEDDPDQALLFTKALDDAGLPPFVRTVGTFDQAKDYLMGLGPFRNRIRFPFPSLVVSDLNLPAGSGLELVRWIRERPSTRYLGFIMLTGSARGEDVERSFESGTNLHLVKSVDFRDVVRVIKAVFARFVSQKTGLDV